MRNFTLVIISMAIYLGANSQTITTLSPTQTSTCAGGNIIVQYETTGTFDLLCTFTAQLSDEWGDFTNAVPIGSVPINTGVIFGTIPSNTPFGFGYRVRVISSNPYVVGTENPFPPIVITSSAISATIFTDPAEEACDGDSITLSVLPNESYIWSTGETTQEITVTQTGSYTVTVTNYLTGCEVSVPPVDITIHPLPNIDLGSDRDLCDGTNLTLDAGSGYSEYIWNDGDTIQQNIVSQTGIYVVMVTDSFDCRNRDTVAVTYHPNPQFSLGPDTTLCSNEYIISIPPVFTSYNWNNGASFNPSYTVEQSGTFHVVVINEWNCINYDTVYVTLFAVPSIELGNDVYACEPPVILNGGFGYSHYNWNNGSDTTQFHYVYSTGLQLLTVTDNNGCSASDSLNVGVFGIPQIDLGQLIVADAEDTVIIDAGNSGLHYQWNTGDTTQTITIYAADNTSGIYFYSVTVTGDYGCTNSDEVALQILEPGAVFNSIIPGLSVYPNPFSETFFVNSPVPLNATLTDISGKQLLIIGLKEGINSIPTDKIAPGLYLLQISGKNTSQTFRLSKTIR